MKAVFEDAFAFSCSFKSQVAEKAVDKGIQIARKSSMIEEFSSFDEVTEQMEKEREKELMQQ